MKKTPGTVSTKERPLLSDNPQFDAYKSSINYGIIVGSKEGKIVDFNQAALDIFGYTDEELRYEPITKIMPGRFRDRHVAGMAHYNKTNETKAIGQTMRLFGLNKNGKEFPMELALSSWQETDGETFFTASCRKYSPLENNLSWILASSAVATITVLAMVVYFGLNMFQG